MDCLNDTTVCFVPAKGEIMDFAFSYSNSSGLYAGCGVNFNIRNNLGNFVYSTPLELQNFPGFPPFGNCIWTVYAGWDGRDNQSTITGHLADPDNGPYIAWVTDSDGDVLTNYVTFYLAPAIDSILLTHDPSYPPPQPGIPTTLYSVIRGKIDDFEGLSTYRYYSGPDLFPPPDLEFWDGFYGNCHFWDLPTGPPDIERQQFYFEDNSLMRISNILRWDSDIWGNLDYKWYVIHDWREYQDHPRVQKLHYDPVDTTGFWSNYWTTTLYAPDNWCHPDEMPYMRLLVASKINNNKNGHRIQENSTIMDSTAHKVIFIDNSGGVEFDMANWAISHIGVPYFETDGFAKNPYKRIECSGLVTATRIQAIGAGNNDRYRIGHIIANNYALGYYSFRLQNIYLNVNSVAISNAERDCLILFNNPASHVAIIDNIDYDNINHEIIACDIIHAYGNAIGQMTHEYGRVRYDDFKTMFWDRRNHGIFTFKRFSN